MQLRYWLWMMKSSISLVRQQLYENFLEACRKAGVRTCHLHTLSLTSVELSAQQQCKINEAAILMPNECLLEAARECQKTWSAAITPVHTADKERYPCPCARHARNSHCGNQPLLLHAGLKGWSPVQQHGTGLSATKVLVIQWATTAKCTAPWVRVDRRGPAMGHNMPRRPVPLVTTAP